MNSLRNQKHQAILLAAEHAFITNGYTSTSMETIAEAAPVSKPTLYAHFTSKHDLFVEVIKKQCDSLLGTIETAPNTFASPEAGLKAIAEAFVDLMYADNALALYRLLIAEQQHFPELGSSVYEATAIPMMQLISNYLKELHNQSRLDIPDTDSSSQLLIGMLKGIPHFRCLMGLQQGLSPIEKRHLIDSSVSLFLKGHHLAA